MPHVRFALALGNLPLALDLVGSYVASTQMTFSRFIDIHRDYDRSFIHIRQQSSDFRLDFAGLPTFYQYDVDIQDVYYGR